MLLTSCMKNSISKMDNNIVTRVYTNELPAINLHDKEIAFYRLNIFDKEFENQNHLFILKQINMSKLDLNLKRDGLKLLKIEALSKQGNFIYCYRR